MIRILVPYHLDEQQDGLEEVTQPEITVTADLPDGDFWSRLVALSRATADQVAQSSRPLVFSGCCLTSLGTLTGLQRAGFTPGVVWFDAHGDVHTPATSTSGYQGGMALRLLTGAYSHLAAEPLGLHAVPEERITLVDARDLDPPEEEYLRTSAIRRATVSDVATALPEGDLYLHIDLDVVDPSDAPGVRFPVSDGPSITEVAKGVAAVVATGRVVGVGLCCTWFPGRGSVQQISPLLEALSPF